MLLEAFWNEPMNQMRTMLPPGDVGSVVLAAAQAEHGS